MGSKKDQPDAGLKSLNHCMRVVPFFLPTRGLSRHPLTVMRLRHRFKSITRLAVLATTKAHPIDPI